MRMKSFVCSFLDSGDGCLERFGGACAEEEECVLMSTSTRIISSSSGMLLIVVPAMKWLLSALGYDGHCFSVPAGDDVDVGVECEQV